MIRLPRNKKKLISQKRSQKREENKPHVKSSYRNYYIPEEWTFFKLRERYLHLARVLNVENPMEIPFDLDLSQNEYLDRLLNAITIGAKRGDKACIELSVQFVAAQVYFFWSGYTRAKMARLLKSADLTEDQKETLREGIYEILDSMNFGQEVQELIKLIRKIGFGKWENKYLSLCDRFYSEQLFKVD